VAGSRVPRRVEQLVRGVIDRRNALQHLLEQRMRTFISACVEIMTRINIQSIWLYLTRVG
jgi:hypothetical protein